MSAAAIALGIAVQSQSNINQECFYAFIFEPSVLEHQTRKERE